MKPALKFTCKRMQHKNISARRDDTVRELRKQGQKETPIIIPAVS